MGIISDKLRTTLDELRRLDAESQIATDNLLASLIEISSTLEALQFDEEDEEESD